MRTTEPHGAAPQTCLTSYRILPPRPGCEKLWVTLTALPQFHKPDLQLTSVAAADVAEAEVMHQLLHPLLQAVLTPPGRRPPEAEAVAANREAVQMTPLLPCRSILQNRPKLNFRVCNFYVCGLVCLHLTFFVGPYGEWNTCLLWCYVCSRARYSCYLTLPATTAFTGLHNRPLNSADVL